MPALEIGLALALLSSHPCQQANVHRVHVPIYPERTSSPSFNYAFQWIQAADIDAPTIVFIPGGPGSPSIASWGQASQKEAWKDLGLPRGYNYLFTDPRTVGCNKRENHVFPDDSLTSWHLASDVLAAIRSLKLKNYYIYGHSYGSLLATIIASRAGRGEAPPPLGVVLTGIIGNAERGGLSSESHGLIEEWELLRGELPALALRRLDSEDSPLGLNPESWTAFIENGLYAGFSLERGHWKHELKELLGLLASDQPKDIEKLKKAVKLAGKSGEPESDSDFGSRLYTQINCSEISDLEFEVAFQRGKLSTAAGTDTCAGRKLNHPYDSADWPVNSPIYYFAGTRDPSTPLKGARYHFDHQPTDFRHWIIVRGGGHNMMGAMFHDCKEAIWQSIAQGGQHLDHALSGCMAPATQGF